MRLRILGCSGGELPRHRTTCFLVDGRLAIDAGALTATLTLRQLARVDDIILTHSHFDHVKDVPLAADLLIGHRKTPLRVHASSECAATLRDSIFNGRLWPDFTRLPTRQNPVLQIRPFTPGKRFKAGRYAVDPVAVHHPVESVGFVLSDGKATIGVSGDTGPTTAFWKRINAERDLVALLVEMSFPNALQRLADVSGHLTPNTLARELAKVNRNGYPVYLYHLKPAYEAELRRDLRKLALDNVRILAMGDEFHF
ncbi:MAG: 3',5'-cyclic-nucleotide phosphodiesterase [Deltaproteobacteria bacterium]|nr:3',5'-cyclic-nucleotide phosphodiesterase [Deltaproteobacteria bacterium]